MPFSGRVWLSALLFSSVSFASPFLHEKFHKRSAPIQAGLVSKASVPRAVAVPSPVQSGISTSCTQYYQAAAGDYCSTVATKFSVSVSDFESWNPAVGSGCSDLWADYYYCVAGGSATGISVPSSSLPNVSSTTGASPTAASAVVSSTATSAVVSPTAVSAVVVSTTAASAVAAPTGNCVSSYPGHTDPSSGSPGNEVLVGTCTVTTANFDLCPESSPCPGNATFYTPAGGATACGSNIQNSDIIVALSWDYIMGEGSNDNGTPTNPYCDSTITVVYNGKSTSGIKVVDKCQGCLSIGHIDLSQGAYDSIGAPEGDGHVPISWYFDSK